MNVLIICERSGVVRDAFIRHGHNAVSCDLVASSSPGPHIIADYHSLDYSGIDILIAHPDCRYLTKAGAGTFWNKHRPEQALAILDVIWIWNLPVQHICIENPAGILSKSWRIPDQYIDPYMFGHKEKKHTGLYLKNLSPLMATLIHSKPEEFVKNVPHTKDRSIIRSRTFRGVAEAMAIQWGSILK